MKTIKLYRHTITKNNLLDSYVPYNAYKTFPFRENEGVYEGADDGGVVYELASVIGQDNGFTLGDEGSDLDYLFCRGSHVSIVSGNEGFPALVWVEEGEETWVDIYPTKYIDDGQPKPVPYVILWAASLEDYSTFVLGNKRRCVAKNFDPEIHKYPFLLKCGDDQIRFAGMMKNDPCDSCEDKAFQPKDEMMNDWGITGMMVYNNDTDTWEDL